MPERLAQRLYRRDTVVSFPFPTEPTSKIEPAEPEITSMSMGNGVAITGICAASFLLLAFLLILNYTDLLVVNSVNRTASADNPNAFVGEFFILVITFSPMIFSYKLCAKIIDKA